MFVYIYIYICFLQTCHRASCTIVVSKMTSYRRYQTAGDDARRVPACERKLNCFMALCSADSARVAPSPWPHFSFASIMFFSNDHDGRGCAPSSRPGTIHRIDVSHPRSLVPRGGPICNQPVLCTPLLYAVDHVRQRVLHAAGLLPFGLSDPYSAFQRLTSDGSSPKIAS